MSLPLGLPPGTPYMPLNDQITLVQSEINEAHQAALDAIQPRLDAVMQQIQDARAAGADISPSWLYEKARLQTLTNTIQAEMDGYARSALNITQEMQVRSIQTALSDTTGQLRSQLVDGIYQPGVSRTFGLPSMTALHALEGRASNGTPLSGLFEGFGQQAAADTRGALISGLALGTNPRVVGNQIAQALDVPRWRGQTIARQEMISSYRDAQQLTMQANSDVVQGWVWVAALGAACICCTDMDGSVHAIDEDMVSHIACRCAMAPLTRGYADILNGAPGELDMSENALLGTSFERQAGEDWFAQQSEAVQRDILGPAKFNAWQEGDLQLKDLIGYKSDPQWGPSMYEKSLKELGLDARDYLDRIPFDFSAEPPAVSPFASGGASDLTRPPFERMPNVDGIMAQLQDRYPGLRVELAGLDSGTANDIASTFDAIAERWPEMAQRLDAFGIDMGPDAEHFLGGRTLPPNYLAGADPNGRYLFVNAARWFDQTALRDGLAEDVARGWIPAGLDTPQSVITHEMGHLFEAWIRTDPERAAALDQFMAENVRLTTGLGKMVEGQADEAFAQAWAANELGVLTDDPYVRAQADLIEQLLADHPGTGPVETPFPGIGSDRPSLRPFASSASNDLNALLDPATSTKNLQAIRDDIISAITTRLEDNAAFTDLVNSGLLGKTPQETVNALLTSWDKGEGSTYRALQEAVRDIFDLKDAAAPYEGAVTEGWADLYAKGGDGIRAFTQAMYDNTQQFLKDNGISEVQVYRGVNYVTPPKGMDPALFNGSRQLTTLTLQPANSFTTDRGIAEIWANRGYMQGTTGDYKMLVEERVPASDILSTNRTGLGSFHVNEVVTLGGEQNVTVVGTDEAGVYLRMPADQALTREGLADKNMADLRQLAKDMNVQPARTKAEMIDRILAKQAESVPAPIVPSAPAVPDVPALPTDTVTALRQSVDDKIAEREMLYSQQHDLQEAKKELEGVQRHAGSTMQYAEVKAKQELYRATLDQTDPEVKQYFKDRAALEKAKADQAFAKAEQQRLERVMDRLSIQGKQGSAEYQQAQADYKAAEKAGVKADKASSKAYSNVWGKTPGVYKPELDSIAGFDMRMDRLGITFTQDQIANAPSMVAAREQLAAVPGQIRDLEAQIQALAPAIRDANAAVDQALTDLRDFAASLGEDAKLGDTMQPFSGTIDLPEGHQPPNALMNKLDYRMQEPRAVTKARIIDDINTRLEDNPAWKEYIDRMPMPDRLGVYHDYIDWHADPADSKSAAHVADIIKKWGVGYKPGSPQWVAMQMATQDEFGLDATIHVVSDAGMQAGQAYYAENGDALRAFLRAMYDNTQQWFADNGITEVDVYRGYGWQGEFRTYDAAGRPIVTENPNVPQSITWGPMDQQAYGVTDMELNPLQSFSADINISQGTGTGNGFAGGGFAGGSDYSLLIGARVPVERILGTAQSGFGAKLESEVVVMGRLTDTVAYRAGTTVERALLRDAEEQVLGNGGMLYTMADGAKLSVVSNPDGTFTVSYLDGPQAKLGTLKAGSSKTYKTQTGVNKLLRSLRLSNLYVGP